MYGIEAYATVEYAGWISPENPLWRPVPKPSNTVPPQSRTPEADEWRPVERITHL